MEHMTNINNILREVESLNQHTAHFLERTKYKEELQKRHGLSESAIKSNLFRTRKKLEKIMKKEKYLK